jgi:DNA-binding LacI/PurR family transcriptional regulator
MQKILRAMVVDGVLSQRGKRYELPRPRDRHYTPKIVFITPHTFRLIPRSALNPGQFRIIDLLEYECNQREFILEIVEIGSFRSVEIRRIGTDLAKDPFALGYIFDMYWYHDNDSQRSQTDLLKRLCSLKKPVAILDEVGDFALPLQFSADPMMQVFAIEGKKAGSRMARHLLGLGHRSVAYISFDHDESWSRRRLDGVAEQFQKAGCEKGVRAVFRKRNDITRDNALAVSDLDEKTIRRILAAGLNTEHVDELYRAYVHFKKSVSPGLLTRDDIRVIRQKVKVLHTCAQEIPGKELFDRICFEVFRDIAKHFDAKMVAPLFERALTIQDVTAWICASDGIALMALAFLRERSIEVPKKLSLVGFDNQPLETLENHLTTFDFNAPGFVHRMLNFIVRPPRPRGTYRHTPIEVEGKVMVRGTTAPARAA